MKGRSNEELYQQAVKLLVEAQCLAGSPHWENSRRWVIQAHVSCALDKLTQMWRQLNEAKTQTQEK